VLKQNKKYRCTTYHPAAPTQGADGVVMPAVFTGHIIAATWIMGRKNKLFNKIIINGMYFKFAFCKMLPVTWI
jgi:hypothetical protein